MINVGLIIKHWQKSLIAISILVVFLFFRKQKNKEENFTNKNEKEKRAFLTATRIRSALGVNAGFWSWTEDENAVIEALNENADIVSLVQLEYNKLTSNKLFNDISKYLSPDDIKKINISKHQLKSK